MLFKLIKHVFLKIKFRTVLKFNFHSTISLSSKFEGMNFIDSNSNFHGEMGFGSYVARNTFINAKIGKFTSIGSFVCCNTGVHPVKTYVSTSPVFYSVTKRKFGGSFVENQTFEENRYADVEKKIGVIIGNDCWIGDGVFLVGGVKLGDGVVALAHSVITKDVPPYAIVGGVPAQIIDFRFDISTIDFLLKSQWWNKDIDWLKSNIGIMSDINEFKKQF